MSRGNRHTIQGFEASASELHGVGLGLREGTDKELLVSCLYEDGPAADSGMINLGDTILSVGGIDVYKKSFQIVTSFILGPKNTTVQLGFRRANAEPGVVAQDYVVTLKRTLSVTGGFFHERAVSILDYSSQRGGSQTETPRFATASVSEYDENGNTQRDVTSFSEAILKQARKALESMPKSKKGKSHDEPQQQQTRVQPLQSRHSEPAPASGKAAFENFRRGRIEDGPSYTLDQLKGMPNPAPEKTPRSFSEQQLFQPKSNKGPAPPVPPKPAHLSRPEPGARIQSSGYAGFPEHYSSPEEEEVDPRMSNYGVSPITGEPRRPPRRAQRGSGHSSERGGGDTDRNIYVEEADGRVSAPMTSRSLADESLMIPGDSPRGSASSTEYRGRPRDSDMSQRDTYQPHLPNRKKEISHLREQVAAAGSQSPDRAPLSLTQSSRWVPERRSDFRRGNELEIEERAVYEGLDGDGVRVEEAKEPTHKEKLRDMKQSLSDQREVKKMPSASLVRGRQSRSFTSLETWVRDTDIPLLLENTSSTMEMQESDRKKSVSRILQSRKNREPSAVFKQLDDGKPWNVDELFAVAHRTKKERESGDPRLHVPLTTKNGVWGVQGESKKQMSIEEAVARLNAGIRAPEEETKSDDSGPRWRSWARSCCSSVWAF